jgi:putative nucleic acid binding protein
MNKSNRVIGLLIGVFLIIISLAVYNYVYKSHRNIKMETPAFVVKSSTIIDEFDSNTEISSIKYLDKTIQVSGLVTAIDVVRIEIDTSISCYFNDTITRNNLLNKKITIKGRCIGFDELLVEIKIDQCLIITN